jgi:hypothetical protein
MAILKKKSKTNSLKSSTRLSLKQFLFFGLIFAAVGGFFLWRSFAATFTLATVGANNMKYSAGSTTLSADSSAKSGYKLAMLWNGTASGSASATSAITSVSVRAKGDQCNGSPSMNLIVDGVSLNTWNVDATSWTNYNTDIAVKLTASGTHTFAINFKNDYYVSSSCDRNLILDSVTFYGSDSTTTNLTKVGTYSNYTNQNNNNTVFQAQDYLPGIGTQTVTEIAPGGELVYSNSSLGKLPTTICYEARTWNNPKSAVLATSAYVTFVGYNNSVSVDVPIDGNYYQICVPPGNKTAPAYNVANLSSSAYLFVYQAEAKF